MQNVLPLENIYQSGDDDQLAFEDWIDQSVIRQCLSVQLSKEKNFLEQYYDSKNVAATAAAAAAVRVFLFVGLLFGSTDDDDDENEQNRERGSSTVNGSSSRNYTQWMQ